MAGLKTFRAVLAAGLLATAGFAAVTEPAQAQYGGYGYGSRYGDDDGEYERPRRPSYDEYDRRRERRYDDDEPRRGSRYDSPRGGGSEQARGSFVQSCRDIEQDGAYLSASCRTRYGGYTRSQIDTRSCRSIGNRDGRLICE